MAVFKMFSAGKGKGWWLNQMHIATDILTGTKELRNFRNMSLWIADFFVM
jgi:hypothetical protein